MLSRRVFLQCLGATVLPRPQAKNVAAVVTVYTHNSHADVIVSRILEGFNLDNTDPHPALKLVSLYIDQIATKDMGQTLARKHGVRLSPTIADALTRGGRDLAVEGVLLIGEHGDYSVSKTGQTMYPRRRFFEDTVAVFKRTGRVVPVFTDKHLSWNWEDAKWMYDTAKKMRIPLMAVDIVAAEGEKGRT